MTRNKLGREFGSHQQQPLTPGYRHQAESCLLWVEVCPSEDRKYHQVSVKVILEIIFPDVMKREVKMTFYGEG